MTPAARSDRGASARTGSPRARDAFLLLIERRVVSEPVAVELETGGGRPRPVGFWRGTTFHRVMRVLERRTEIGMAYMRVLTDRGAYDLRRVTTMDAWTWRSESRWELVAELTAIPLARHLP